MKLNPFDIKISNVSVINSKSSKLTLLFFPTQTFSFNNVYDINFFFIVEFDKFD